MSEVDVPAGYPVEFERSVRLRDDRMVLVRPITPSDADELGNAIRAADADTLRRRFLGAAPAVTPKLLDRLTEIDYVSRFALVARDADTGHGVGIARYEPVDPGVAEIAVVVDAGWRRVGLATALVRLLAEAASSRGIRTFTAYYLATNRAVQTLLADAGGAGFIKDGIAESEVALDPAWTGGPGDPGPSTPSSAAPAAHVAPPGQPEREAGQEPASGPGQVRPG